MHLSEPRIPPAPRETWSEEVRTLLEGDKPGRPVKNVFATLANHPELFTKFVVFGAHIRRASTLDPREREILILRTGWLRQAAYEWAQHKEIAMSCGMTEEEIELIKSAPADPIWSHRERLLMRAADELDEHTFISDRLWAELAAEYDVRQLIDIVFTVGMYVMVSMALNTFGVQLEEGQSGF